ncbi:MAG: hypothetical protein AABW49_05010 [Nanoarchaeota archaeon]
MVITVARNNKSLAEEYAKYRIERYSRSLGKKNVGWYGAEIDEILYEKRLISNYSVSIEELLLEGKKPSLDRLEGVLGEVVFRRLRQFVSGSNFRCGFDPENNFDALPHCSDIFNELSTLRPSLM